MAADAREALALVLSLFDVKAGTRYSLPAQIQHYWPVHERERARRVLATARAALDRQDGCAPE